MHLCSRFFATIGLVLFCAQGWATPQQLQDDLQQLRLSSTAIMTNFYMFSGLDLDSRYKMRLEQNSASFEEALTDASLLATSNDLQAEVETLQERWKTYQKLIDTNLDDMITKGFPNVRLVDEMSKTSIDIVGLAAQASEKLDTSSGTSANEIVKQSRDLALLMEQITSQYAARNTSNLGQVFAGNSTYSLVEMADDFTKKLNKLSRLVNSEKTANLLNSIQSKWRFMEQRIRNYNENAVVFLVVSYNDKIIDHLQELEAIYR